MLLDSCWLFSGTFLTFVSTEKKNESQNEIPFLKQRKVQKEPERKKGKKKREREKKRILRLKEGYAKGRVQKKQQ